MNDSTRDTLTGRSNLPEQGGMGGEPQTSIGSGAGAAALGDDASMPRLATGGSGAAAAAAMDPRIRRIAEGAHGAIDRAVEKVTPSIDRVGREVDRARMQADALSMRTRDHVREHPMSSLLVAFMAGLVIGSLSSR